MSTGRKFFIGLALLTCLLTCLLTYVGLGTPSWRAKASRNPASELQPVTTPALLQSPNIPYMCQHFYQSVCQKLNLHDPTGSVHSDIEGEKMVLQLSQDIIQQHPSWSPEQINGALVDQIFTPKRRGRIVSSYRWVKNALLKFVDKQPEPILNSQEKAFLKNRIQKTKLQLPPPLSLYADEPDLLTKNEAHYERTANGEMRLRIGGAYVMLARSWFNLVDTFAHELAHSIDPCELRAAHFAIPAYDRLTACFLKNKFIETRKDRSECVANDQLSEIFADWVAAHLISEALTLYATEFHGAQIVNAARNSFRDLCVQDDDPEELDLTFHPSPQLRIEKIFGYHPGIRQVLGCQPIEPPLGYCSFEQGSP